MFATKGARRLGDSGDTFLIGGRIYQMLRRILHRRL